MNTSNGELMEQIFVVVVVQMKTVKLQFLSRDHSWHWHRKEEKGAHHSRKLLSATIFEKMEYAYGFFKCQGQLCPHSISIPRGKLPTTKFIIICLSNGFNYCENCTKNSASWQKWIECLIFPPISSNKYLKVNNCSI